MQIAITVLGVAMAVYCTLVRIPRQRAQGLRLLLFWLAVIGATWMDNAPWLIGLAIVLLAWPLIAKALGLAGVGDAVRGIDVALSADFYRDRERGIRRAVELATPEAWSVLVSHLANVDAGEDEEELMAIFRGLIDGWGVEHVAQAWPELPAQARMDFLEFSQGNGQYRSQELLTLARRGMDDEHEAIARRAWRTYAYTVTTGAESGRGGFDLASWLPSTAGDTNTDVQGLRVRLQQKRIAEMESQGLDALVARYRAEVFKAIRPTPVRLQASRPFRLQAESGEWLELDEGLHTGQLGGQFDSAQDAVTQGWHFVMELTDAKGQRWSLDATWPAEEFFGELLDGRYDDQRHWFETAPEELSRAFSMQPLVGPVAAYSDTWDLYAPRVQGDELRPVKKQVLYCLMALVPGNEDEASSLAFLIYELEDASRDGDEARPFVTLVPLERWLLSGVGDDGAERVRVQRL